MITAIKHPATILGPNQIKNIKLRHVVDIDYKGPNVITHVNIGPFGVGEGHKQWMDDCMQSYRYVLLFLNTAKATYAQKAADIIKAWSIGCVSFRGLNAPLECGWGAAVLVRSAEILKYLWPGWNLDLEVNSFLNRIIIPNLKGRYIEIYKWSNNWILTIQEALLQIALYQNNVKEFNYMIQEYRGVVPKTFVGEHGQNTETQRDICPHCQFQIASHIQIAEIAHHQGITDLYTTTLQKSIEYHAAIINGTMPCDVPKDKLKDVWFMPGAWEIAYNHYTNRMKLQMPETKRLLDKRRPEGMSFNWGPGFIHQDSF